jgi:hypothetical protein
VSALCGVVRVKPNYCFCPPIAEVEFIAFAASLLLKQFRFLTSLAVPNPAARLCDELLQLQDNPGDATWANVTIPLRGALAPSFTAQTHDGRERQILAVVTTVELDPKNERYRKGLVDRLSAAARDYVARSDQVKEFVLMSRPKDWRQPAEAHRRHPAVSGASARHESPPPA